MRSSPDRTGASNENPKSRVAIEPMMVTVVAMMLPVAWLGWHANEVDDVHEVVLHEACRCTVGELLCVAKFRPCTVTLVPPDNTPFLPLYGSTLVTAGES